MEKQYTIIIAGAGGIAEASALLLAQWSKKTPMIYIGNRTMAKAQKVAQWIQQGVTRACTVVPFQLDAYTVTEEMKHIFEQGDALLDCLPGGLAPKMAQMAKDFDLFYANLTEYVDETDRIKELAKNAKTGFVLQTGLAPGYINVLAHHLFQEFCADYKVGQVDKLECKVGALTINAVAPHYYGFTWSPVGVATEYIKEAVAIRDYKKVLLPSLSEGTKIIINGITYEEDLTSGGAADLPDALRGKVGSLDYKTLRHPGHYGWIREKLQSLEINNNRITALQQIMEFEIPQVEDDQIVLYASVQGKDTSGVLRRREISKTIRPQKIGHHYLRAIQTTTAAPLLQSIQWLLEKRPRGIILQSDLPTKEFLNGNFIIPVYGKAFLDDNQN